jgi:prevent-host-death family protein
MEHAMNKIIGVTELQRRFRSVFDEVVERHIPYILTRGSRPEAVLVPYDQYLKFVQADEAGVLKRFDAVQARMANINTRYSEDEVEADLQEATRAIRSRKKK